MLSTAIGALTGVILGGAIYEKFIRKEEEIKVEYRHEYRITSKEKSVNVNGIASKIKEKLEQSSK